jgi:hypothetical protein
LQDDMGANSGSAYLYRVSSLATSPFIIQGSDVQAGDYFGYSVGLDGIYVAIGAQKQSVSSLENVGSAYVYEIDTTTHQATEIKKITSDTSLANELFGSSVAVDGDFISVGAIEYDEDDNTTGVGSVYVFDGEPAP